MEKHWIFEYLIANETSDIYGKMQCVIHLKKETF